MGAGHGGSWYLDTVTVTALSVAEAQQEILEHVRVVATQEVPVADSIGRVLAIDVASRVDLPARALSVMDGVAVRSEDVSAGRTLRVIAESAAGAPADRGLRRGECIRISTGAVIPAGADAVLAQEDTRRLDDRLQVLETAGDVRPGTLLRAPGTEVRRNELLLHAGHHLGPGDAALAASAGHDHLTVRRRPSVAILQNGDELVPPGAPRRPGQIVATNGFMLAAQVREAGATPIVLPPAPDRRGPLDAALERGLECDVLVTSGGISVGPHDLVLEALAACGCTVMFRGLAMRPGRPATFARTRSCLVFALPGNPASSFVTFEVLVRPALRTMLGAPAARPTRVVRLTAPITGLKSREHFVRARLDGDLAEPHSSQGSGNLRSITEVHALIPMGAGVSTLQAGESVRAIVLPRTWPT